MIHTNKSDTAKHILALSSRGGGTNSRRISGKRTPLHSRRGKEMLMQSTRVRTSSEMVFSRLTKRPCVYFRQCNSPCPAPGEDYNYHENENKTTKK